MSEKPTYEELERRIKELEQAEQNHKQMEEALRESEERYKNLFKNNHSVMLIINPETGDIVDANPAATSFYGWTHGEITCRKITDINTLSEEQVFQEMEKAKQENRRHFYFRHRLANGDIRDVEVYSGPIKLFGKKLLYSIIHDISERRKAEEEIRVLSKFPSENPNPILRVGMDGTILYSNNAGKALLEIWNCELGQKLPDEWCEFIFDTLKSGESQDAEIKHAERITVLSFTPVLDAGYVNIYGRDITDRKKAEEKLRVSEAKFRELTDMLPQIVFETDEKGNLTYANKNAFEIFGYTKDKFTSGLSAMQMISPKDREQAAERMLQIMTGQNDLTGFEYTAIKKDGTEFPVIIYSTRILRDGKLAGLRGILIDTTERKRAEEALKESEAFLKSTGKMAKVGGWQLNADTLDLSWTDEIFRIYELPLGQVPPLEEAVNYFHPDDRPKLEKAIQKALDHGEPYNMEIRLITAKGKHLWTHTICEPIMVDGKVVKLNGTFQDISGRKQAEEALIESEKKYQQLFLHAPAGIYEVDFTKGRFIRINSVMCDYTGYSREELLSMSPLDILTKESQVYFLERLEKLQKGENVSATPEFCIKNKDGSTRWVQLNSQFSYKKGMAIGATVVVHDISERKRAEAELKKSEERIARSRKMESLGLLAGGVAHDLNNVLSGIVSYPELMLMDLPEDSKLREPIETIKESGERAAAIVQDLLTVARGVAINKNPLNLCDLVGDYIHSPEFNKLQQLYPTVTFKTNFDEDLFNISGSHVHTRKAVMNLVSNAAEAIKSSGMVTISIMNRYMDRPLRGYDDVKIGEYVVLSVSDDGSGITSDDLERIFEPFYTKKVMGRSGTGLGLAVVWNIMLDHKGYIDVITDENGTTFELYFPTTREEVSDKDLSIPINNYKGNGEMILVVDDVESQRNISCRMLEKLGYQTKSVPSGEEAIEYLKENTTDLILLDMIMDPGINGRQTYEQIIKMHPKQKAIIVSGFAVTGDVKATQKLGAGKYIKKPYTIEKIGLAIQEELGK